MHEFFCIHILCACLHKISCMCLVSRLRLYIECRRPVQTESSAIKHECPLQKDYCRNYYRYNSYALKLIPILYSGHMGLYDIACFEIPMLQCLQCTKLVIPLMFAGTFSYSILLATENSTYHEEHIIAWTQLLHITFIDTVASYSDYNVYIMQIQWEINNIIL